MKTKTCTACNESFPETEFYWIDTKTKNKRCTQCRKCKRVAARRHYLQNREKCIRRSVSAIRKRVADKKQKLVHKFDLKCERCGENHPAVLDFHHTDPSKKDFGISAGMRRYGEKRILVEIKKCEVLCSNCHRKHHWTEKQNHS